MSRKCCLFSFKFISFAHTQDHSLRGHLVTCVANYSMQPCEFEPSRAECFFVHELGGKTTAVVN